MNRLQGYEENEVCHKKARCTKAISSYVPFSFAASLPFSFFASAKLGRMEKRRGNFSSSATGYEGAPCGQESYKVSSCFAGKYFTKWVETEALVQMRSTFVGSSDDK